MKNLILIFVFAAGSNLSSVPASFAQETPGQEKYATLPELNRKVLVFVDAHMKKKVGRGECWDLAAQALNQAGAKWNGKLKFGRLLDLKTDTILPGDIIQFEGVKLRYEEENGIYKEVMKHHTGIVYSMTGSLDFDMANQNTSRFGRKVAVTHVNLNNVVSGKYFVYRPVR